MGHNNSKNINDDNKKVSFDPESLSKDDDIPLEERNSLDLSSIPNDDDSINSHNVDDNKSSNNSSPNQTPQTPNISKTPRTPRTPRLMGRTASFGEYNSDDHTPTPSPVPTPVLTRPLRPYTQNTNIYNDDYRNSIQDLYQTIQQNTNQNTDVLIKISPEYEQFRHFSRKINDTYMNEMTYYSITLDLIALYLKAQRVLYVESKTYCELCLYILMLPTIFISAVCTVLSLALKNTEYGSIVISGLSAFNSFNLTLITYLKLDAKAEAHKSTAYQFDKLTTLCEFYSGKVQMYKENDTSDKVKKFVDNIEKKISEIKDVNQFIVPEIVRIRYSMFYSFNVFEVMRKFNTLKIKDHYKLLVLDNKIKENDENNNNNESLLREKEDLINKIIEYRSMTTEISDIFNTEIKKYNQSRKGIKRYGILMCLKT